MKLHTALFTLTLLASAVSSHASGPSTTGAPATPANRIVGTWSNISQVGSCDTGVLGPLLYQTLQYHAGGTMLDNSRFPPQGIATPGGVVQRSIGLGNWRYEPAGGQYSIRQQFDFYLDNGYDGYMVIERTGVLLSNDGNEISGPVVAIRYNAVGVETSRQCGVALSTRL